ncbi:MAG: hypothetical protein Q8L23_16845 [Caulobacter sp.]|nr:hypothetical protein [Caulobacter sp.]
MKFPILAAIAVLATAAAAPSAQAMGAAGVILDPKCLSESAWEVDATQAPIKFFGCRPAADIPAANAGGWTVYTRPLVDGTDGGFTQVKMLTSIPPNKIVFLLVDNGGGSGNFGYKVTGVPGPDGVLQEPTVEIWNGGN